MSDEKINTDIARLERKVNAIGVAILYLTGVSIGSAHSRGTDDEITNAIENSQIVRELKAAFYPEEVCR